MAIETKDILEYLGLEGVEKLEDFRAKFEPVYVKKAAVKEDKELYGSLVGKVTGSIKTSFVRDLKKEGVELSKEEIDGLELEKVLENGLGKIKTHYISQIDQLKSQVGKGSEDLVKELQDKYSKLEGKYHDTKSLLDTTKETFNKEKESWQNQIKGVKLQTKVGDAFKSIKWRTGVSEIEKKGFFSILNEKYKMDLDEQDNLEIMDTKGQRIPNTKKNGEFKNINEILEEEGTALKVWEVNPVAGNVRTIVQPQNGRIQSPALETQAGRPRILSPAAIANEGKR